MAAERLGLTGTGGGGMFSASGWAVVSLVRRVRWRVLRAVSSAERPTGSWGEGWQDTWRSESMERGRRIKVSLSRDILSVKWVVCEVVRCMKASRFVKDETPRCYIL